MSSMQLVRLTRHRPVVLIVITFLSFSPTYLLGCFQAVAPTLVPGTPVSADIAIELLKESMICQEAIKHSHLSHPC